MTDSVRGLGTFRATLEGPQQTAWDSLCEQLGISPDLSGTDALDALRKANVSGLSGPQRELLARADSFFTSEPRPDEALAAVVGSRAPTAAGVEKASAARLQGNPPEESGPVNDIRGPRDYIRKFGGDPRKNIRRLLIANNGMSAVKGIQSFREWMFRNFGNERVIEIIVMATPEDREAYAEYINLADRVVEVPGGPNYNNYANVGLIVETARAVGADAVWPGWGHAAENPELPKALEKAGIIFVGPGERAMRALGDKIASLIIAQSSGVSVIPWSGSSLNVQGGDVPVETYKTAAVKNLGEAIGKAESIGWPVMLKAAGTGGGRGMRVVRNAEEMRIKYPLVVGESAGTDIFVMKLAPEGSRHVEIQIVADAHGNAVALFERDCSVQRRHQKIIEEGPASYIPDEIRRKMREQAVALAKRVGYVSMGTVEFLYDPKSREFYFLELNSRLQVEHPVTEGITGLGLPGIQLALAMGVPLHHIPEIRQFYNQDPDALGLDALREPPANGHVIAVRITAEDTDKGFQPTSGRVLELNFKGHPDVWGYFSVGPGGSVHQFADTQIGHLFAWGRTREDARINMILALKRLEVRGEIKTNREYLIELLQHPDFVANDVDIGWLDRLIAERRPAERPDHDLAIISGAVFVAHRQVGERKQEYVASLIKGRDPDKSLLNAAYDVPLVYAHDGGESKLYSPVVQQIGDNSFAVTLNDSRVKADVHVLSTGLRVVVGGKSHIVFGRETPEGLRLEIDGMSVLFTRERDPSQIKAAMPGTLVRYLIEDGAHVDAGEEVAVIEAMKMEQPVKAEAAGTFYRVTVEGGGLDAGQVFATLKLDDPSVVRKAAPYKGKLEAVIGRELLTERDDSDVLRESYSSLSRVLEGYSDSGDLFDINLRLDLSSFVESLASQKLAFQQLQRVFQNLATRLPPDVRLGFERVFSIYSGVLTAYERGRIWTMIPKYHARRERAEGVPDPSFPEPSDTPDFYEKMISLAETAMRRGFERHVPLLLSGDAARTFHEEFGNPEDYLRTQNWQQPMSVEKRMILLAEPVFASSLVAFAKAYDQHQRAETPDIAKTISPLVDLARQHQGGKGAYSAGLVNRLLAGYLDVEEIYAGSETGDAAGARLRNLRELLGSWDRVYDTARSHDRLPQKNKLVLALLSFIESQPSLEPYNAQLKKLADLRGDAYQEVSHRALRLLMRGKEQTFEERLGEIERRFALLGEHPSMKDEIMTDLVARINPVFDLLTQLFKHETPHVRRAALEAYVRRAYRIHNLRAVTIGESAGFPVVQWLYGHQDSTADQRSRTGTLAYFSSMDDLNRNFDNFSRLFRPLEGEERDGTQNRSLTIALHWPEAYPEDEEMINERLGGFLKSRMSHIERMGGFSRITFAVCQDRVYPNYYTFRYREAGGGKEAEYVEDPLYRHVEPPLASQLELRRLDNFKVQNYRAAGHRVHVYYGEGRRGEADVDRRFFVRAIVRGVTAQMVFGEGQMRFPEVDSTFRGALDALELASRDPGFKRTDWNQIFMNIVPVVGADVGVVQDNIRRLAREHAGRLRELRVTEVEVRIRLSGAEGGEPKTYRFFAANPTGYTLRIESYEEVNGVLRRIDEAGEAHRRTSMNVNEPYRVLTPLERRTRVAQSKGTTYVYDIPGLFSEALDAAWRGQGVSGDEGTRVSAQELVLNDRDELVATGRPPGQNSIGMVAWRVTLRTPEYPAGREMILIANDFTFQSGSFAPKEDLLYQRASALARQEGIPRIYIAANSGARLGLDKPLMAAFKVAFAEGSGDDLRPEYLYLTSDDHRRFKDAVRATKIRVGGEVRWRITDIIGVTENLNHENLRGSGMIAGETSRAYDETFTLTYVMGLDVGIGSYITRLGQRVIQKEGTSVILTGFQALNTLLGQLLYASNEQLGGTQIMLPNGVSHLSVGNDLEGMAAILNWLSYVPAKQGDQLPVIETQDPIDRAPSFKPTAKPYDPHLMIAGGNLPDDGGEVTGFFDKGSFTETLASWGKTVITGRARLGGIPMGVVAVETRAVERVFPVDPGDPASHDAPQMRAGQVWYPDSAYKTAQAISDFDREGLPLMVFANWRGFSGGTRDMFDEVLKFGSYIVDNLRAYRQPVFIYMPPHAELRGGAWVVVDPTINEEMIEMYAAPEARGGILEPEGLVRIMFRDSALIQKMHQLDKKLMKWDRIVDEFGDTARIAKFQGMIREREQRLLPVYRLIAAQLADLHDTPERMKTVGVISDVVPWEKSREYFYWRVKRRVAEVGLRKRLRAADPEVSHQQTTEILQGWIGKGIRKTTWRRDKKYLAWIRSNGTKIEAGIAKVRADYVRRQTAVLATEAADAAVAGVLEAAGALPDADRGRVAEALEEGVRRLRGGGSGEGSPEPAPGSPPAVVKPGPATFLPRGVVVPEIHAPLGAGVGRGPWVTGHGLFDEEWGDPTAPWLTARRENVLARVAGRGSRVEGRGSEVIPAEAGIRVKQLDPRLRGDDIGSGRGSRVEGRQSTAVSHRVTGSPAAPSLRAERPPKYVAGPPLAESNPGASTGSPSATTASADRRPSISLGARDDRQAVARAIEVARRSEGLSGVAVYLKRLDDQRRLSLYSRATEGNHPLNQVYLKLIGAGKGDLVRALQRMKSELTPEQRIILIAAADMNDRGLLLAVAGVVVAKSSGQGTGYGVQGTGLGAVPAGTASTTATGPVVPVR